MTKDEMISRGLAAKVLLEDESVKAFFDAREKQCFERAMSAKTPDEEHTALVEVRIMRALRQDLIVTADAAKNIMTKKEKLNAR